jgi:hypothetical protein
MHWEFPHRRHIRKTSSAALPAASAPGAAAMIQPEDIRRKAISLYRDYLQTWLESDESFFPHRVPVRRTPDPENAVGAIESTSRLHEGSKQALGFGYTVEWKEVNAPKLGGGKLPTRIVFETREDLLRFTQKEGEFKLFAAAVTRLRSEFPVLESWVRHNVQRVIELAPELEWLLQIVRFLREHPRPNLFVRELPIPVDTSFVERHQQLLREWLDVVLSYRVIRADESHFERRYGLRYAEPHLHVRLLDRELELELGFPCPEFSLPLHTMAGLSARPAAAFIVESRVNLLTLPPLRRMLGLGALGESVTLLRYIPWLQGVPIVYWGDLDVQGFEILSSLRAILPQTRSILMDHGTLGRWRHLCTCGHSPGCEVPPRLADSERAAFLRCRDQNLRLEQERLPKEEVSAVLSRWQQSLTMGPLVELADGASKALPDLPPLRLSREYGDGAHA